MTRKNATQINFWTLKNANKLTLFDIFNWKMASIQKNRHENPFTRDMGKNLNAYKKTRTKKYGIYAEQANC